MWCANRADPSFVQKYITRMEVADIENTLAYYFVVLFTEEKVIEYSERCSLPHLQLFDKATIYFQTQKRSSLSYLNVADDKESFITMIPLVRVR